MDAAKNRESSVAIEAEQYLARFLGILVKLERSSPAGSGVDPRMDEEAELRHWADLRDYQNKFAEEGQSWVMS